MKSFAHSLNSLISCSNILKSGWEKAIIGPVLKNATNKIWLFDYDLTLYGEEERYVLNSLDKRIALYVQKTVGGTFEQASEIRRDYLLRFGTTLAGLQAMHGVDPEDFFDFIHEPEFLIYPKESPQKRELLLSLNGRRIVFTNGRHDWSEAGMKSMGFLDVMDAVFDLKQMDWVGKPHESAYEKMETFLGRTVSQNRDIILLEDSLRNLEPAHKRGWTTIFVNPLAKAPECVNYQIPHLMNLSEILEG